MEKIENVPVEDFEAALEEAEGRRETQRLMAAIMCKHGPSVPMIAEWLDMRDGTIYEWHNRSKNGRSRTQSPTITDREDRRKEANLTVRSLNPL